jgi:hypothetical protein
MGLEFYDAYPEAREIFTRADEVLGIELSKLCFEGPEEELRRTSITQPAILTVSIAVNTVLERKGIRPDFVMGHSLGEYSALVAAGWVTFPSGMFSDTFAPYWIITMWMLFATTINLSMRWMRGRPWLAAAFGLVGGPLAYYAGHKIGGIVFVNEAAALAMLAAGWALMMPLLMRLGESLDGVSAETTTVVGQRVS